MLQEVSEIQAVTNMHYAMTWKLGWWVWTACAAQVEAA